MLRHVSVTSENIDLATSLQQKMFPPEENARRNYEESIDGTTDYSYFIVYDGDTPVGVSGLYHYDIYPESAWLGWFGILEEYRRKGFGSETVRMFEELARSRGYRYARLYTDKNDNETAIAFYKSNGYVPEEYNCPEDPICMTVPLLIFSKSLDGGELVPWNNRNLFLTEQIAKQTS